MVAFDATMATPVLRPLWYSLCHMDRLWEKVATYGDPYEIASEPYGRESMLGAEDYCS
jgi:hypothetical protein